MLRELATGRLSGTGELSETRQGLNNYQRLGTRLDIIVIVGMLSIFVFEVTGLASGQLNL